MAIEKTFHPPALGFFLILLLMAWNQTADAGEPWNFYGELEFDSFIEDSDEGPGGRTLDFGIEKIQLGAKYREGRRKARFELGQKGDIRRLWGEYKFGKIWFLAGKDYTPVYMDYCLDDYGGLSAGRRAMLRLRYKGFKIAAIEPRLKTLGVSGASKEVKLPKMEISYNFAKGPLGIEAAAGFNRYTLKSASGNYDVNSWVLGLGLDMAWGPLYLGGSIHTSQNPGPYGLYSATDGNPVISGSQVHANDNFGYAFMVLYRIRDNLMIETGWGQSRNRVDTAPGRDMAESLYLLLHYAPVQGLWIRPEIGIRDYEAGLQGLPKSRTLYYGIKWKVNF
ncbi:hypothetical protein [Desulfobacter vibrioformis]|uniref:hypothetical protein n=1 Tax=Desulfobacter vibrioformis TaxID=34031 RepID=UPI00054F8229|nr:hypothetical protein [Desulfobacter vibrioformis]